MANLAKLQLGGYQIAHDALLFFDWPVGVHDQEIEIGAHGQILFKDAALENAETFVRISREPQIHAGLEIFQLRTAVQDALQGNFQRRLEEKHQVRQGGEIVNAAHPFRRAAAHGVAGEGGENVAVAQHDVTGAQKGHELAFVAVGEIGGVNQAESCGGKQLAFFSLAGGVFDQRRRNSIR